MYMTIYAVKLRFSSMPYTNRGVTFMKKMLVACAVTVCLAVCGCAGDSGSSSEPQETDKLVAVELQRDAEDLADEISQLYLEPGIEDTLDEIQAAYDAFPDEIKKYVDNYSDFTALRDEYDDAMDSVQAAIDAIDGIGTVDENSKSAINNAESLYNAVNPLFVDLVTNYDDIAAAREQFKQAVSDKGVADARALTQAGKYQDAMNYITNYINEHRDDLGSTTDLTAASQEAELYWAWDLYEQNYLGYVQDILDDLEWDCVTTELSNARDSLQNRLDNYLYSITPADGTCLASTFSGGYGEMTIYSGDRAAVVKIENYSNPSSYRTYFLRANSSVTFNVPDGTYIVKYATGDKYFGDTAKGPFGNDTSFYQSDSYYDFSTTRDGNYIYYSQWWLTIYAVEGGNTTVHSIDGL